MQTPTEKYLIEQVVGILKEREGKCSIPPHILNIGAGQSLVIENQLTNVGSNYICDRIDIDDCVVVHPSVDNCYQSSVESMSLVPSGKYTVAFANYVLEHVRDLSSTAREIHRVLKPSGRFVASIPNPTAPQFMLARRTPLWFHKMIKRKEVWEAVYSYSNVSDLTRIFEPAGFCTVEIKYYSCVEGYLYIYPLLGKLGRWYDKAVSVLKIKNLMGEACVIFEKIF